MLGEFCGDSHLIVIFLAELSQWLFFTLLVETKLNAILQIWIIRIHVVSNIYVKPQQTAAISTESSYYCTAELLCSQCNTLLWLWFLCWHCVGVILLI